MRDLFMPILIMTGILTTIGILLYAITENNVGAFCLSIVVGGLFYLAIKGLD